VLEFVIVLKFSIILNNEAAYFSFVKKFSKSNLLKSPAYELSLPQHFFRSGFVKTP
jgi:hypothetical protein